MPEREIKTRFKLDGEAEFRRGMSDAAAAIKVLDSEQKLAEAQFKQTGNAEAFVTEKTRILTEKIAQQKKATETAEKAMKELVDKGVKPTNKTYQEWATRLNTARTRLTDMETQLQNVDGIMQNTRSTAESTGEALSSIGGKIDYANTITSLNTLKTALDNVLTNVERIASAIWSAEVDAGKWADDLATAAAQAGVDVETYQSWQYASQFIDTEAAKIAAAINRTSKNVGSESEDLVKTFNALGVATRNADGSARDAESTFWATIDALHGIKDPTQQAIYANKLFGDSWTTLRPLIDAGSDAYKNLTEEGRSLAVVSEKNVSALGEFDDKMNKLNSTIQKDKMDLLAGMAPGFSAISDGAQAAATAFGEFINSQEGQAALDSLNSAIQSLVTTFLGEDNGKGTFEAILGAATAAVEGLTSALEWISQNGETVKGIVTGLGVAFATLHVAPGVLAFVNLLQKLPLPKLSSLFGGGGAGAGGSAASAAAGGGTGVAGAARAATLGGLFRGVTTAGLVYAAGESAVNMYNEVKDQHTLLGIGARDEYGSIDIGGIKIGGDRQNTTSLRKAIGTSLGFVKDTQKEADAAEASVKKLADLSAQYGTQVTAEMLNMAASMNIPLDEIVALHSQVEEKSQAMIASFSDAGKAANQALASAIQSGSSRPISAAERLAATVSARVSAVISQMARLAGLPAAGYALPGMAGEGPEGGTVNATINMDGTLVGRLVAPIVNKVMGAQLNGR